MPWAPDYITSAELAAFVRDSVAVNDVELAAWCSTASRAIDQTCNRQFGKVDAPEQRFYTARWSSRRGRWVVDIDDLMSITGVVVLVGSTAVTKYTLEPRNAAARGRPWTRLVFATDAEAQPDGCTDDVGMTAPWGWTSVPTAVKQAAKLQGSRFVSRRDSPFGVAGSPVQGSELRLLARVDPDVAVSLLGLTRPRKVG
jgi:hypothetical protein